MNDDHKIFNWEITLIFRRWSFNLWFVFIPISIDMLLDVKNISSILDDIPPIADTGAMEVYQKWPLVKMVKMPDTTGNECLKRPIPRLFQDSGPSTSKKREMTRAQRNTTPHKYENIFIHNIFVSIYNFNFNIVSISILVLVSSPNTQAFSQAIWIFPQVDANTPTLFGGYLGLGTDEERDKLR
jgi:hypothetical protein